MKNLLIVISIIIFPISTFATIDGLEFSNPALEDRFKQLNHELRCPKCQNQTIADSNAPIAKDLRHQIYQMLEAGNSNAEIVNFLVERYGEFVRYQPMLEKATWLLWFGPVIFLIIGLLMIGVLKRRHVVAKSVPLSSAENQAIQELENK